MCLETSSSAFHKPAARPALVLGTRDPVSVTLCSLPCLPVFPSGVAGASACLPLPPLQSPALPSGQPLSPAPGLALATLVPSPSLQLFMGRAGLFARSRCISVPPLPVRGLPPGSGSPIHPAPSFQGLPSVLTHSESCFRSSGLSACPAAEGSELARWPSEPGVSPTLEVTRAMRTGLFPEWLRLSLREQASCPRVPRICRK